MVSSRRFLISLFCWNAPPLRMAGITRFEDLIAWQRARTLAAELRRVATTHPLKQDQALASQMCRAATSVMANVAEGFESSTPAEFNRFLGIARASAAEVRSHLYVALDAQLISQREFDQLMQIGKSTSELVAPSSYRFNGELPCSSLRSPQRSLAPDATLNAARCTLLQSVSPERQ
jgi:four helix bundle protein